MISRRTSPIHGLGGILDLLDVDTSDDVRARPFKSSNDLLIREA
jgi:hypothetical protein